MSLNQSILLLYKCYFWHANVLLHFCSSTCSIWPHSRTQSTGTIMPIKTKSQSFRQWNWVFYYPKLDGIFYPAPSGTMFCLSHMILCFTFKRRLDQLDNTEHDKAIWENQHFVANQSICATSYYLVYCVSYIACINKTVNITGWELGVIFSVLYGTNHTDRLQQRARWAPAATYRQWPHTRKE